MKTIKKGDHCSETAFYTVQEVNGNQVILKNDEGQEIEVNKGYAESFLTSASEFEKVEKLSRTELIEKFTVSTNVAVTANFFKQVKQADVEKEIQEAYENSTPKEFPVKVKKALKGALSGVERTMILKHFGTRDEFGRIKVWDLEVAKTISATGYDSRQKALDPRTLEWFICRGVKYQVK